MNAAGDRDPRQNDSEAMASNPRQEVSWDSVDDMLENDSVVFPLAEAASPMFAESGL
jgi:hypothetical protein